MFTSIVIGCAIKELDDTALSSLKKLLKKELSDKTDNNSKELLNVAQVSVVEKMFIVLDIIVVFIMIDYDINNKDQWPYNGESASKFLRKSLRKALPTKKQLNKLRMIGSTKYRGLDISILNKYRVLYLLLLVDYKIKQKRLKGG